MKRLKTFPSKHLPLVNEICVSISIDLDTSSAYSEKDSVTLSNFLKEAEKQTSAAGFDFEKNFEAVRNHSRELLNNTGSLLLYITKNDIVYYHIQQESPDKVFVSTAPFVKPLIQYYQFNPELQVLVLNQDHARLFSLESCSIEEIKNNKWPIHMTDALGDEKVGGELTHGSYGSRGTDGEQSYHGHNETSKEKEIDRENFFRYVDNLILETMSEESTELILFSLPENQAVFRKISKYDGLLEKGLELSGAQLSDLQIAEQVENFTSVSAKEKEQTLFKKFKETSPEFRVENLDELTQLAKEGRVEEVILSNTLSLEQNEKDSSLAIGLITNVFESSGKVYIVDSKALPSGVSVSGRLRY